MQPRSYVHASPKRARSSEFSEKGRTRSTRSPSNSPRLTSPLSSSLFRSREVSPAKTATRSSSLQPTPDPKNAKNVPERPRPTPLPVQDVPVPKRTSARDVLSATAIPIRRKPRGRPSQRLPKGDYVAEFSRLLMDDIKQYPTGNLSRSVSSSNLDGLFGNMDELLEEGQMYIGSEGLDSGILSARSMSDDSFASMPSPDDFTASDNNSQHSSTSPSIPERRIRHLAASEDCTGNHPLSPPRESDSFFDTKPGDVTPSPTIRQLAGQSEKKPRVSLVSSLTASLKALKSAAQSVAPRTTSSSSTSGPSDVIVRSFFDIQPSLTDDRRPPPSPDEPTPELRRYLNPPPLDSAAQLHFWQDHRHSAMGPLKAPPKKRVPKTRKNPLGRGAGSSNSSIRDLPPIVQLADCLPPSVRTEHASSPPIWLTPDGIPVNKSTAIPLLFDPNANDGKGEIGFRHREPRENRDFLRVFVCEMQMRRSGKLSEDLSAGRARLWLPPVVVDAAKQQPQEASGSDSGGTKGVRKHGKERFACLGIEDV